MTDHEWPTKADVEALKHRLRTECADKRGPDIPPRMYGLTDYSGTAMAVSAICYNHYQDESKRKLAREWANADMHGTPYDGGPFVDVSGNDEMECQFCCDYAYPYDGT